MLVLPGEEDEDNPDPWAGVEVETVAVPKSPLCDDTIPPTIRWKRCIFLDIRTDKKTYRERERERERVSVCV